jgi:hypothetical protein
MLSILVCRRFLFHRISQVQTIADFSYITFVVVDLAIYPNSLFTFLLIVGLLITRRRRKRLNIPRSEFRAWNIVVYFAILVQLFVLVLPWYPPPGGADGGDVSFWYGTYIVVGLSM